MPIQSLALQTNAASLKAQRNLMKTEGTMGTAMARLSSGLRINIAADDAAGLAISEKLRASIRGLSQAQRNSNDGISMLQTAEGGMNEVSDMLIRMRELSVQSANSTLGTTERTALNQEFSQLKSEITRIADTTEFNGRKLINGGASANHTYDFQVGIQNTANDRISVTINASSATALGLSATVSITTMTGARSSISTLDTALKSVNASRGKLGASQNRLQVTINNLSAMHENLSAANSRIRDADVATETANMARGQILMQAGIAVLSQANQLPSMALSLIG